MSPQLPNPCGVADAAAAGTTVPAGAAAPRGPLPQGTVKITSERLFAGALEVQIEHHGALYRLKKTSLGKLILTK